LCAIAGSALRSLDPGLPASSRPPPGAGTAAARLENLERQLVLRSGQRLILEWSGQDFEGVFYAPFSTLWLTDKAHTVWAVLRLHRDGDYVRIDTDGRTTFVRPEMLAVAGTTPGTSVAIHPLAAFHDRLLQRPLVRDLAAVPAGSQFLPPLPGSSSGIVQPPTEVSPTAILWTSSGDVLHITGPDGVRESVDWRVVNAALVEGDL